MPANPAQRNSCTKGVPKKNDMVAQITSVSAETKAENANLWEKISPGLRKKTFIDRIHLAKIFKPRRDSSREVNSLTSFLVDIVWGYKQIPPKNAFYKKTKRTEAWSQIRTSSTVWGEYVVRNFGWEWVGYVDSESKDENVPLAALLSKNKKIVIITDLIALAVINSEVKSNIFGTLYQQIAEGKRLESVKGVVHL